MNDLADGAHLFSDRVSEQAVRVLAVDMDVSDVPRWASADYRFAGAAGVGCARSFKRGSDDEASGNGFAKDLVLVDGGKRERAAIESLPFVFGEGWVRV